MCDRRNAGYMGQHVQFQLKLVRGQKGYAQHRLRYSEASDHNSRQDIHNQESFEILWSLQHGVPEKDQRSIVKVDLQTQQSVKNTRRPRVENLNDCEPEEKGKRQKERDLEDFYLAFAFCDIVRHIGNP